MRAVQNPAGKAILFSLALCLSATAVPAALPGAAGSKSAMVLETSPADFTPVDVEVGDPTVNYANVEFTSDGRFMVWFEGNMDGTGRGVVWHCGVDPATGDLIPPDGKGFRAFESTMWGRANPGVDADGVFYVGMDRNGRLVMVRPTGPTAGDEEVLPTLADTLRRSIYPTMAPDDPGGYVYWIRNGQRPGGGYPGNDWFDLQYIDLSDPEQVHTIERQNNPPGPMLAPMDIGFARWMEGKPVLTYGSFDSSGVVQVRAFDPTLPLPSPVTVTEDAHSKIDPYGLVFNGLDILLPGLDGGPCSGVYTRHDGEDTYTLQETICPEDSTLDNPALAQSNQPIEIGDNAYSAFQVNEAGGSFWDTVTDTGEIWLSTILRDPPAQWRLSEDSDTSKMEPEPYVGSFRVWVFYSSAPKGSDVLTARWALRRADTPLSVSSLSAVFVFSPESPSDVDPVLFQAVAWGGAPPYQFTWDFCGHSETGENITTRLSAGTCAVTLTVTDAVGTATSLTKTVNTSHSVSISKVVWLANPPRLKVKGAGFATGCTIRIDGTPAPKTAFKKTTKAIAKGGRALKTMVPKNAPVQIEVVNPDGTPSAPFPFTR